MNKSFLPMIIALIANSVTGQPAIEKIRIMPQMISQTIENLQGTSDKGWTNNVFPALRHVNANENRLKSTLSDKLKLDSVISEDYDSITGQWRNTYKEEYTYDANGHMVTAIMCDWDDITSRWLFSYKQEYAYNADGSDTIYISSFWEETLNQWLASGKHCYTYNDDGNILQSTGYEWDENDVQWIISDKQEYTFDDKDYCSGYLIYNWDEDSSGWIVSGKVYYANDSSGNDTLSTFYFLACDTCNLVPKYITKNKYDDNGNLTSMIMIFWDEADSQWVALGNYEYSYDANGNMNLTLAYEWDENTGQWNAEIKEVIEYDFSYSIDDLMMPVYYSTTGYFSNMPTQALAYEHNGIDWILNSRSILFYSPQNITNITIDSKEVHAVVFPNPASDCVTFNRVENEGIYSVEFFDIRGIKIMSKIIQNGIPVSIQNLPEGIYIYKLEGNGIVSIGKLLVAASY